MYISSVLPEPTGTPSGLTDDEWLHTRSDTIAAALRAGTFPILAAESARNDVELTLDTLFEFGLRRTLDGIALLCGDYPAVSGQA